MAVRKNDPAPKADATTIEEDVRGVVDPAPEAVDVTHESVDANPRAGTTATQNCIDWNDPKRVRPDEPDFTGQGVNRSVYGKAVD